MRTKCEHCGADLLQNQNHDQGCPSLQMHRYRWYSNINWGPCYDPETKAHYASATDIKTLVMEYGPIDLQSLQVHNGSEYRWASESPVHLGGFAKSWHGERV